MQKPLQTPQHARKILDLTTYYQSSISIDKIPSDEGNKKEIPDGISQNCVIISQCGHYIYHISIIDYL